MPFKIAILFTGQIRTLLKTIENFKKNVIEPNKQHTLHIYTCLEYPHSSDQNEINQYKTDIQHIFDTQFEHFMIHPIFWLSSQDKLCGFIRDKSVETMYISDLWKDYLRNRSGSVTEYYQLYKGYEQIENYEIKENIKYDLFIRTRCDIYIPQPLELKNFQFHYLEIIERFLKIKEHFPSASIAHCIALYITSIPQPLEKAIQRITTPKFTLEIFYHQNYHVTYEPFLNPYHPNNSILSLNDIAEFIQMILPSTRLTYRQNLFYMGLIKNGLSEKDIVLNYKYIDEKRIKYTYSFNGSERTIKGEEVYWFNAENIYQKHVIENNILIVNSYTESEEKSLYDGEFNKDTSIFTLLR